MQYQRGLQPLRYAYRDSVQIEGFFGKLLNPVPEWVRLQGFRLVKGPDEKQMQDAEIKIKRTNTKL